MSLFDIFLFLFRVRVLQPSFLVAFQKTTGEQRCKTLKNAAGKSHWAKHLQPKYCQESCGQRGTKNGKLGGETSNMFYIHPYLGI